MADLNIKTIRFPVNTDQHLETMARKLGRSKLQFFMQMVNYFYRTKKDPADVNDEALKNTLLRNHQNLTGFIKTQEKDLLIPVKHDVERMIQTQKRLLECFNTTVLEHNQSLVKNQLAQVQKFADTDRLMKAILDKLETREKLKTKFQYILEQYIRSREAFNAFTSGKEKEELIQTTRQQISNL
ncbi:MAG: BfmA/BtgA family mobilization protein [Daejeonella sp.]